jgi:hypothetical protein
VIQNNLSQEFDMNLEERLDHFEQVLQQVLARSTAKSYHTVDEIAVMARRSAFTVREWCRLGRIRAEKAMTRSGASSQWRISQTEYERFCREGLLPISR